MKIKFNPIMTKLINIHLSNTTLLATRRCMFKVKVVSLSPNVHNTDEKIIQDLELWHKHKVAQYIYKNMLLQLLIFVMMKKLQLG